MVKKKKRWGDPQKKILDAAQSPLEEQFHKEYGGELRRAGFNRTRDNVQSFPPRYMDRQTIHFHKKEGEPRYGGRALPSIRDMRGILSLVRNHPGIRLYVISRITRELQESGRIMIRISSKFRELYMDGEDMSKEGKKLHTKIYERMHDIQNLYRKETVSAGYKAREKMLALLDEMAQYGIHTRFVPMKGYRFDKNASDFVPLPKGR